MWREGCHADMQVVLRVRQVRTKRALPGACTHPKTAQRMHALSICSRAAHSPRAAALAQELVPAHSHDVKPEYFIYAGGGVFDA